MPERAGGEQSAPLSAHDRGYQQCDQASAGKGSEFKSGWVGVKSSGVDGGKGVEKQWIWPINQLKARVGIVTHHDTVWATADWSTHQDCVHSEVVVLVLTKASLDHWAQLTQQTTYTHTHAHT